MITAALKDPDAALRCFLRHCGVRQVRLMTQALRALPAEFFTQPSMITVLDFPEFVE
jgi:hypothetical protein